MFVVMAQCSLILSSVGVLFRVLGYQNEDFFLKSICRYANSCSSRHESMLSETFIKGPQIFFFKNYIQIDPEKNLKLQNLLKK